MYFVRRPNIRQIVRFSPSKFFELENTVSVFKYGSTVRSTFVSCFGIIDLDFIPHCLNSSNQACDTRIHDFIVVIDEGFEKAVKWHQMMITNYPLHYSKISLLGPKYVSKLQRYSKLCPIFYNSCILASGNKMIKYGIVSKDDLANSLINWTSPFILNRFQKMIFPIGVMDAYLQSLLLQCDIQTIRLSLLSLCKDTLFDDNLHDLNLNNSDSSNYPDSEVSLLEFLHKIVNSSYKGNIRFLFNSSSKELSEKELQDSLPFLTARYLPLIISYFQNNKSEFAFEGVSLKALNELCILAKSISDKMSFKLLENPLSGMNSEFRTSEDWNKFFRLFFNKKITLKINPSKEWRKREFFKLPDEFKSRASRISARKRFLKLLPINLISNKYINYMDLSTLPWSSNVIDKTIRRYNLKCSIISILKNMVSNFGKIIFYVEYKLNQTITKKN